MKNDQPTNIELQIVGNDFPILYVPIVVVVLWHDKANSTNSILFA